MTKTTKTQHVDNSNPCPGILAAAGFILILFGAGGQDFADAQEYENQCIGYEKNVIDIKDTKKAEKTMMWGMALAAVGGIGLALKERSTKTR